MLPEPLPGPPPDLFRRKISLVEFNASLVRTHGIHHNPIFFGSSGRFRFDAPNESYKVLYAGRDAYCAFVETFGWVTGARIVTTTELKNRALSELRPTRSLRLVDLTQSGTLVRIGADARLFSGEHKTSQLWSKALHDHPAAADGLLYPSRLDPQRHGVVLFGDRAPKLHELMRQSWYASGAQRRLLVEIVEHYQFELIENQLAPSRKPAARARQQGLFPGS